MNKRTVISFILLLSLIMMPVSGVIVHATHGAAISHTWLHLHILLGVIFCIAGIFHLVNNWRFLKNSLMGRNKKETG